jgi:hypothetical protein
VLVSVAALSTLALTNSATHAHALGAQFVAPRCKHSMALIGNFLVIIGGCGLVGPDDFVTHVTVFNVETHAWDVIRPEISPASSSFSTLALSSSSSSSPIPSGGEEAAAAITVAIPQGLAVQQPSRETDSPRRGSRSHRRTSSGGGVRKWVYASTEPTGEEATPVQTVSSMILKQSTIVAEHVRVCVCV